MRNVEKEELKDYLKKRPVEVTIREEGEKSRREKSGGTGSREGRRGK